MTSGRRLPIWTIVICLWLMALVAVIEISFWPSLRILLGPDRVRRTFYIPSESMLPTLRVNDRIVPRRITARDLRRGMVVVFSTPNEVRVARIVGLPGDTVALSRGVVSINGRAVLQRSLGEGPRLSDGQATQMLIEQLPGEDEAHLMLDGGESFIDEMPPVEVPANCIFVLGDDRDRAADSRLPASDGGVGMVPINAVIGEVDTVMWSHDRDRIGKPIDAGVASLASERH